MGIESAVFERGRAPELGPKRSMNDSGRRTVVMVGPFGMGPRGTMRERALPMAQALVARGYEVTVLMPPWHRREASGRTYVDNGVQVRNIRLPPPIPGLFQLLITLQLTSRVIALKPEIVHLFKPKAYSGLTHWLLRQGLLRGKARLVVDADDWEGPGGWNELGDYSAAQRWFFAWQERWGLTHADAVTVASRTLESLVWAMGVPPGDVFYVPNGVGQAMDRDPSGTEDLRPCILLYTRFIEFPISRVLSVFSRVRELIPDAQLLVVGEGLFGEEEQLLRLADGEGLTVERLRTPAADRSPVDPWRCVVSTQDIVYAGWVPCGSLPSYFGRADVAIYPFDDTLINRAKCAAKLRDLLAAGVPVVAEAVGQNREYIRQGQTGLLVAPGDLGSFVDAVVLLLRDRDYRRCLGEAAARDVRERFAWDRLIDSVESAYQSTR
jgi:glycosyltransferase involved in cell wall biosynthesis